VCPAEVCPAEVCIGKVKKLGLLFVFAIPSAENRQDSLNIRLGMSRKGRASSSRLLRFDRSNVPNVGTQNLHNRPVISFRLIGNPFQSIDTPETHDHFLHTLGINCSKLLNGLGESVGNLPFLRYEQGFLGSGGGFLRYPEVLPRAEEACQQYDSAQYRSQRLAGLIYAVESLLGIKPHYATNLPLRHLPQYDQSNKPEDRQEHGQIPARQCSKFAGHGSESSPIRLGRVVIKDRQVCGSMKNSVLEPEAAADRCARVEVRCAYPLSCRPPRPRRKQVNGPRLESRSPRSVMPPRNFRREPIKIGSFLCQRVAFRPLWLGSQFRATARHHF